MFNENKLREWLDDHIDDYIDLGDDDGMMHSYSADTNKMAHDLMEFIKEQAGA